MYIKCIAYKDSGKFYGQNIVRIPSNVHIYEHEKIAKFLNGKIPFIKNGYITIESIDSNIFFTHLFLSNYLQSYL